MSDVTTEIRAPSTETAQDTILPFEVAALDVRGRVVTLGPALDQILGAHDYPVPVAKLLGEAVILTVMLGTSLKFDGRFILQTQTEGPVRMLVVDFTSPGSVRACARFDAANVQALIDAKLTSPARLMGEGHLAMTIDQGGDMSRYQGLVALTGGTLEDAAHEYFLRSEQIPTRVRLAIAEQLSAGPDGPRHNWRAGGMMVQFLPAKPDRMRTPDLPPGDAPEGIALPEMKEDEAWVEARALVETVTDLELIDPELSSERLLYRLFHERGVRVFREQAVQAKCTCSRESVSDMLASFSREDRVDMIENGVISVTCEFCNSKYVFQPAEVGAAPDSE